MRRADVVLLASAGKKSIAIAAEQGVERTIVARWRNRFAKAGPAGIERDAPRGGRPATKRQQVARRTIETTTQRKPDNATHWSTNSLAKELGLSPSMVSRVWRANGLKPRLVRTFKVSNAPRFVEKMTDIVGL